MVQDTERALTRAPRHRRPGRSLLVWVFPVAVVALFLTAVGLDLNGSSMNILSTQKNDNLLFGHPQVIRADEYVNTTPLAINQARLGFPAAPYVGLTPTDSSVWPNLPSLEIDELARPQTWGYILIGASRGVAWQWWFPLLVGLLGLYWLVWRLTRSISVSIALAAVGSLSPYVAWWSNWPALSIGLLATAGAAILQAFETKRLVTRLALAGAAAYAGICAVLTLYPPWIVGGGLVIGAVVVGIALDVRLPWRWAAQIAAACAGLVAVALAAWYLVNASAFAALTGTIYPGQRVSEPGQGIFGQLSNAASSGVLTDPHRLDLSWSNLSEVSSPWIALPIGAVIVVFLFYSSWGKVRQATKVEGADYPIGARSGIWTISLLTAVGLVLFLWAYTTGLPAPVAQLTLMTQITGNRVPFALGLLFLVLVALSSAKAAIDALTHRILTIVLLVAATVTVVVNANAATGTVQDMTQQSWLIVIVGAAFAGFGFAALAANRWTSTLGIGFAVFALASYAMVNPLVRGIAPYTTEPLSMAVHSLAEADPSATAVVMSGQAASGVVRASGVEVVSGQTIYPDREFWEQIAPGDEALWNNYRNYEWVYDPTANPIVGTITGTDAATLKVDLCSAKLAELNARIVVATPGLKLACGSIVESVNYRGQPMEIWRINS